MVNTLFLSHFRVFRERSFLTVYKFNKDFVLSKVLRRIYSIIKTKNV